MLLAVSWDRLCWRIHNILYSQLQQLQTNKFTTNTFDQCVNKWITTTSESPSDKAKPFLVSNSQQLFKFSIFCFSEFLSFELLRWRVRKPLWSHFDRSVSCPVWKCLRKQPSWTNVNRDKVLYNRADALADRIAMRILGFITRLCFNIFTTAVSAASCFETKTTTPLC